MSTPYFYTVSGAASNAPSTTDNEATSLQKINGLLTLIASGSSGGSVGHFDALGNIQVFDSVNSTWRSLTAPNGVLTVT